MNDDEWENGFSRSIGVLFNGCTMDIQNAKGEPILDDTFLLLFNAHFEPISFQLPAMKNNPPEWNLVIHTEEESGFVDDPKFENYHEFTVAARAMAVFQQGTRPPAAP